jgi:hypothetical protein
MTIAVILEKRNPNMNRDKEHNNIANKSDISTNKAKTETNMSKSHLI